MGAVCFAELARARAQVADVVVVNLHLYGLNVASGNVLLPEHDVVVIDEAHQLEDIMSDTVGVQIGPGMSPDDLYVLYPARSAGRSAGSLSSPSSSQNV